MTKPNFYLCLLNITGNPLCFLNLSKQPQPFEKQDII